MDMKHGVSVFAVDIRDARCCVLRVFSTTDRSPARL